MNGKGRFEWASRKIELKKYNLYELCHDDEEEVAIPLGGNPCMVHTAEFEAFTLGGAMERAVAEAMQDAANLYVFERNDREAIEVRRGEFVELCDERGELVGHTFGISIMGIDENVRLWNGEYLLIEDIK